MKANTVSTIFSKISFDNNLKINFKTTNMIILKCPVLYYFNKKILF